MIVIRDRVEYRKHLENYKIVLMGQLLSVNTTAARHAVVNTMKGIDFALETLDAWERWDKDNSDKHIDLD